MDSAFIRLLMVVLVPIGLASFGVRLLLLGLRGRRIDDHPLCRRCWFDLTGKPSGVHVCSECGADLTERGAIGIGHRQRRGGLIAAASALLALALGGGVAEMLGAFDAINWQRLKPLGWLESDALSGLRRDRLVAFREIDRRILGGDLTAGQFAGLVNRALQVQGDRSQQWDDHWASYIEAAHASGKLTAEQWQRYAKQSFPLMGLSVRKRVARGDELPAETHQTGARTGQSLSIRESSLQRDAFIDDQPLPHDSQSSSFRQASLTGTGGNDLAVFDLGPILNQLSAGKHQLRVRQWYTIRDSFNGDAPDLYSGDVELQGEFELLPPEQPSIALVTNPGLQSAMDRCFSITNLCLTQGDPHQLRLTVNVVQPVLEDVGFDVIAVGPTGKEWKIGSVAWSAGRSNASWTTGGTVNDLPSDLKVLDIHLRASVRQAGSLLDAFRIWNGEVVLKSIPLTRPTPRG